MTIGQRIKTLRTRRGLTLEQFSKAVGVGKSTVSNWETGLTLTIKSTLIGKIAETLDTTQSFLLGYEEDVFSYDNIFPLPKTKKVPLVGVISCGEPILATENVEKRIEADAENVQVDFALRCKGNSMVNARIFDGDIVFVRQQADVDNGEIAAVLIGDEATLKRVYHYKDRLELRAENPLFPPVNFEGEDMARVKILGKAVAFMSWVH